MTLENMIQEQDIELEDISWSYEEELRKLGLRFSKREYNYHKIANLVRIPDALASWECQLG